MRTTIAIEDELFEKLREAAAKRRISFTKLVNEVIRRGLTAQRAPADKREPFRVDAFESAFRPGVDPMHLNKLLDDLEARDEFASSRR